MSKLKVIELFAGVGGFRVGLNNITSFDKKTGLADEDGKWDFVWANQWEPSTKVQHAFNTYITRFGDSDNHVNEDISLESVKSRIPNHDLLVGGFPCQDYSVARSVSNEQGIQGKKGVLWWEIYDIVKTNSPKMILLENVDRLLKSPAKQRGRDFSIMLKSLDRLNYVVEWRVVNAGEYGMPQRRRRVFILAYPKKSKYAETIKKQIDITNQQNDLIKSRLFNMKFPIEIDGEIKKIMLDTYQDEYDLTMNYKDGKFENTGIMYENTVLHCRIKEKYEGKSHNLSKVINEASKFNKNYDDYLINDSKVPMWEKAKGSKSERRTTADGFEYFYSEGTMTFPDDPNKPGRTMLTSEGTLNRSSHIIGLPNNKYRTITEVEAELLNTFPPNWTNTGVPSRSRYFMMGNALVTRIMSEISDDLFSIISNDLNK